MADLDAEFARFAAELATVEQEVAVEEPAAAAPAAAPAHPPPSVAAPPTSGPSSTARAAATLAAPPQPAGAPTGAAQQSHFPLPSAPPPVAAPPAAPPAFQMPSAPPPFAAPAAPPPVQQPPAAYGGAQQQYYGGHGADMYGHGHMQHAPAMHAPSVLAPPVPSADMLQRLKADLMKQEKQANPKIKNLASSKALAAKAASSSGKGVVRQAAGKRWFDPTLGEWPENDFRVFVGDIGNEVNDDHLAKAFQKYSSFAKAKVVRCARTNKTKGYGFVSFLESADMVKALKEMNGKYIGNRPCKLSRSNWDERSAPTKRKGGEQQGGPQKRAG